MSNRAIYLVQDFPANHVVAVFDEFDPAHPTMTVTNDVEHVIQDLAKQGLLEDGKRVIYRDTTGTWDEIVVKDGRFVTFRHLGAKSVADALAQVCSP